MNVELMIEQLVLDGIAVADRGRLGAAVEAELSRLFAELGVPPALTHGSHAPRLDGGSIQVAGSAGAEALGAQVARAVYGGLQR